MPFVNTPRQNRLLSALPQDEWVRWQPRLPVATSNPIPSEPGRILNVDRLPPCRAALERLRRAACLAGTKLAGEVGFDLAAARPGDRRSPEIVARA